MLQSWEQTVKNLPVSQGLKCQLPSTCSKAYPEASQKVIGKFVVIPDREFYTGFFQVFWSKAIVDHGVVKYWVCSFWHCSCFLAAFSAGIWKNGTSGRKSIVSMLLHSTACTKHTGQRSTNCHHTLQVRMWVKIRCFSIMKSKLIFPSLFQAILPESVREGEFR